MIKTSAALALAMLSSMPAMAEVVSAQPTDWVWMEQRRSELRTGTAGVGRWLDGLFGDSEPTNGDGLHYGRLSINTLWREDSGTRVNLRFRARFDLPNLKRRSYLFIGQDNTDDVISDQPEAFSAQQRLISEQRRDDHSFFAGLGYALRDNVDLRAGFRGALNPYLQARYARAWSVSSSDLVEFRETLFWKRGDGFGATTALDYTHALNGQLALRWQNAATVSEATDGLAWSSSLGPFLDLGRLRRASAEALIGGQTGSDVDVAEYGLRLRYQQEVYRDWLIGELTLGHFRVKEAPGVAREQAWALGVRVDVLF